MEYELKEKDRESLNINWYRKLYEYSPLMCFIIDTEGYVHSVNKKGEEVLGYDHGELIGCSVLDVFHEDDKEHVFKQFASCIKEPGKVHSWEFRKIRKDGSMLWVKESAHIISEHEQSYIYIICEDITEQKKEAQDLKQKLSEEAHRKSEEHFRLLVETTNVIPWEADIKTRQLTYVGPQAQELLGFPLEMWYEQDFLSAHIHPEDSEKTTAAYHEAASERKDCEIEYRMVSSDGNTVWFNDLVSVITEDGEPVAIRGFKIDITERKQADSLLLSEMHILEMISQGKPLSEILEHICLEVENQTNRMLCSFCLVDSSGKALVSCAAPSMSPDYGKDIGHLPIGPRAASCGTAAFTKKQVIASDTSTDPLWTDFQDLARNHNLQACWSNPILSNSGELLGTFAMYYSEPREPIQCEFDIIERATNLARIAIERKKAEETLKENLEILSKKNRYEEIISTVTRSVHSSINFQDVLENAVESISKNMRLAENVSILMIEGDEAVLKTSRGLPKWFIERMERIPFPRGFSWKVLTEGELRYCPDVDEDEYIGPAGREVGTKSYLSVPFKYHGDTIGCINLHSFEKNAFSEDEIKLLGLVAQQIETAIGNAKQAEALRESEERYRTLYDQSPLGVFTFDKDLRITSSNKRLLDIMKASSEGMQGLELRKLNDQKFTYLYEEALKGNQAHHEDIYDTTHSNIYVWLSVSAAPLTDARGNIFGGMAVVEDVTSRKEMEERLAKSQKLESLGILAGGIAHDFNNLLTSIMGNLSLATTNPSIDNELLQLIGESEDATKRAAVLVSQLLTFSKGGAPVKKLFSNFSDYIIDIVNFTVSGSNVRCKFSIDENLWNLEVDHVQISQVIENLVINSKQAMPGGGEIKVTVKNYVAKKNGDKEGDNRYIKISLEDNGGGIPENILNKIFDPYFTTKDSGHGLGLSSVYSIVDNHGGYIDVESEPGKGSTFHIYLPANDQIVEAKDTTRREIAKGRGKILIMDDENLIKIATGRMLKKMGYEVDYASDGEEAIQKYKSSMDHGRFDLIIMDLTIPGGMGGCEAVSILKSIDPDVKVVVSSGYSNDPVMSDYKKYGFVDIVKKPYNLEVLGHTIENVLTSETE